MHKRALISATSVVAALAFIFASSPAEAAATFTESAIPLAATAGSAFAAPALDPSLGYLIVPESGSKPGTRAQVAVFSGSGALVKQIQVGAEPPANGQAFVNRVVFDPTTHLIYALAQVNQVSTLTIINDTTLAITKTFQFKNEYQALAEDPASGTVWLRDYTNHLVKLTPSTGATTVTTVTQTSSEDMVYDPTNKELYLLDGINVLALNASTLAKVTTIPLTALGFDGPDTGVLLFDQVTNTLYAGTMSVNYINNLSIINTATNKAVVVIKNVALDSIDTSYHQAFVTASNGTLNVISGTNGATVANLASGQKLVPWAWLVTSAKTHSTYGFGGDGSMLKITRVG